MIDATAFASWLGTKECRSKSALLKPRPGGHDARRPRPALPPGTGVSHSFLAGPDGVTMLVYGTRRPNDMCSYPRSRKLSWLVLVVIGRIEALDYFDGEPED
jgi:hypothetical protein